MLTSTTQPILRPGRNAWRIERARRAAVLIDAAPFFRAVREAMLKAQRCIFMLGWDMHTQTPLVGETGEADDGFPRLFGDFVRALADQRPHLEIHLLTWDFAFLYAAERELFPRVRFGWQMPDRVHFRLDSAVPLGSSQHQKLIIIDDLIAFSGGLDVTIRRWDTSSHELDNPHRVDPAGAPYAPFHDVQMMVDGGVAQALGDLARKRWHRGCGEAVDALSMDGTADPWPDSVVPDFTDVDVGIARSQPAYDEDDAIGEVEPLFLDSIDAAERSIYIENQFLTFKPFAERLAQRIAAKPGLEALIVAPEKAESWIEYKTMRSGRILFARELEGVRPAVRLVYPEIVSGEKRASTMIHSKVMIVDDRLLRVGSANLNNRSMAADTECDLVIEAHEERHRDGIRRVRDRLIADHCGVEPETVADELQRHGSLLKAAENLSGRGHRLKPIDDGDLDDQELAAYLRQIADPHDPIGIETVNGLFESWLSAKQRAALLKLALAVALFIALTLVWYVTPLSEFANLEEMRRTFASFSDHWYGAPVVVGIFVLGGLVSFPLTVLIAATAAAFGPALGILYASAGALASAVVTYAIGALIGRDTLRQVLGPRLDNVRKRIAKRGVMAVAAVRLVPIAPFTLVNIAAGASEIRTIDFIIGTVLGLAPGMIVLSLLGGQVFRVLTAPTLFSVTLLLLAIAAWVGVTLSGQYLLTRLWKKSQ
jgi:phospholipase D1/2